jgi:nucleotide-binding universal stress UspA family protein
VFGIVISRRAMHFLPLVGMVLLAAGIAVFRASLPANVPLALVGSALTGLALGATVAPALFVAGFSLQSNSLQRVFAIIELLRAVAAFMVAPIFAHLATRYSGDLLEGTGVALWVGFALAIGGAIFGVAVYALSGARPQTPDLDEFLDGDSPAWYSPPLLARLRGRPSPTPAPAPGRTAVARHRHAPTTTGPVLFAYDGSELAKHAIAQAAEQLSPRHSAVVVCVWQPVDVGFTPVDGRPLDADRASDVRLAAERTAAHGAALADEAGFHSCSLAIEASPTWKGIVEVADEHAASMIVLGPHRRSGLLGHLQGSVAAAVVAHTSIPVLLIPERAGTGSTERPASRKDARVASAP